MKIPDEIRKAFASDVEMYGDYIYFLGTEDSIDFFSFKHDSEEDYGFPTVIGICDNQIYVTDTEEAFRLIDLFKK